MIIELLKRGGFVTLVCGIFAVILAFAAQSANSTAAALADHGQTAIATVTDKERETTRRRTDSGTRTRTSYEVTYEFEADSRAQRVTVDVSEEVYDDVSVGDEVEIRYLPEDPQRVEVYPGQMAGSGKVMGIIAGVFGVVAAIAAAVAVLLAGRRRSLPRMA